MKTYKKIIFILAALLIMVVSILIPNIFFKIKDKATFDKMEKQSMEQVDLTISSNLSICDKLYIINHEMQIVDLTSEDDPSEHRDFSLMFDDALEQLNTFFEPWDLYFNEADVISVEIYKYLYSSSENSNYSFTGWEFVINYPVFTVTIILDYDTFTIMYLNIFGSQDYYNVDVDSQVSVGYDYETTYTYFGLRKILEEKYYLQYDLNNLLYATLTKYYGIDVTRQNDDTISDNINIYSFLIQDDNTQPFEYYIEVTDYSISFNNYY